MGELAAIVAAVPPNSIQDLAAYLLACKLINSVTTVLLARQTGKRSVEIKIDEKAVGHQRIHIRVSGEGGNSPPTTDPPPRELEPSPPPAGKGRKSQKRGGGR